MPTEKYISKNCKRISIGGYEVLVDPNQLIIDTDPKLDKLKYQGLYDVYNKYKKRTTFTLIENVPYPLIVSNDSFRELFKQNPSIGYLASKFDCELF